MQRRRTSGCAAATGMALSNARTFSDARSSAKCLRSRRLCTVSPPAKTRIPSSLRCGAIGHGGALRTRAVGRT